MLQDLLFIALGFVILLLSGDALVRGAVNLSLRLGVPALIVSLTIVAFGTSAPELLISVKAILDDSPGIALGNVVGSNTANVLMVLGVPALLFSIQTSVCETKKTYVIMIGSTLFFIALCFAGPLTWWHGLLLLALLAVILGDQFRQALAHRRAGEPVEEEEDLEGADPEMPGWQVAMWLVFGLVGLPLGANILVDSAVDLARDLGVSEAVIGLTMIAIGTSLPELATTVTAAYRRQADVILGNVIGSNMFNLLAIIGVAAIVGPIPVEENFVRLDLWVMLAASLVLAPLVFMKLNMNRAWGIAFLAIYGLYLWMVVAQGAVA
ncbi:MAG: calcium/sodium antiporter [Pseudomonadota bacterium]